MYIQIHTTEYMEEEADKARNISNNKQKRNFYNCFSFLPWIGKFTT